MTLGKSLHISWKDTIYNDKVRECTQQRHVDDVVREQRLRWRGHVQKSQLVSLLRLRSYGFLLVTKE